jgi:hypothetical protein
MYSAMQAPACPPDKPGTMTSLRPLLLVLYLTLAAASPALAQEPRPQHWGLVASIAPWRADDRFKVLYDARNLDLSGNAVRFGITRGGTLGNEWALMIVRRTIKTGASMVDASGETYRFQPGVKLTGFMAEQFGAFGTIARRVQIGGLIGGGLARVEGTALADSTLNEVQATELLTLFARPVDFQLLLRAELAVAVKVARGAKIRFSGGFDWPGTTTFTVSALYFFADK